MFFRRRGEWVGVGEPLRRLSSEERARFRRRGVVLTILGLVLFFTLPFLVFAVFVNGMFGHMSASSGFGFPWWMALFPVAAIPGIVCLVVGRYYLALGYVKAVSEILSTETEGAVENTVAAVSRGWAGGRGSAQVVKVKCRKCGFLESEDAKFCSQCSKAI